MKKRQAKLLADITGGSAKEYNNQEWIVAITTSQDTIAIFSLGGIFEYQDWGSFISGEKPLNSINFNTIEK